LPSRIIRLDSFDQALGFAISSIAVARNESTLRPDPALSQQTK
jgi:hypothetical protein